MCEKHRVRVDVFDAEQTFPVGRQRRHEEAVDVRVEGVVFAGARRQRRQTVAGVVGDVAARRVAAAGVHRGRVPQRHVLVDVAPTVETLAELGHQHGALLLHAGRLHSTHGPPGLPVKVRGNTDWTLHTNVVEQLE